MKRHLSSARPVISKLTALSLMMVIFQFAMVAPAQAEAQSGLTYVVNNNEATVTGCDGSCTADLVIPATLGGYSVTAIDGWAFAEKGLTSVVMPDSITTIGHGAFNNNQISAISIPPLVTRIGDWTFASNLLTTITIPDAVTELSGHAFYGNLIQNLVIPNSVVNIGFWAFGSNAITSLVVGNHVADIGYGAFGNNPFDSIQFLGNAPTDGGDVWFGIAPGPRIAVLPGTSGWGGTWSGMPVDVSSGCTSGSLQIVNQAVVGNTDCAGIVIISAGVVSIGAYALANANQITNVIVADSVRVIQQRAFANNPKLADVTLGSGVETIGDFAFATNISLSRINFPSSLRSIGSGAFLNDLLLANVVLNDGLNGIAPSAFENTGLTSITIPDSVRNIGPHAFAFNASLTTAVFGSGINTIENCLMCFDPSLTSLTIGDGVDVIGAGAFTGDVRLAAITQVNGHGRYLAGWYERGSAVVIPQRELGSTLNSLSSLGFVAHRVTDNSQLWLTFSAGAGSGNAPTEVLGSHAVLPGLGEMQAPSGQHFSGTWKCTPYQWATPPTVELAGASFDVMSDTTCVAQWSMNVQASSTAKPTVRVTKLKATATGKFRVFANAGTWVGSPSPTISYQWYSCQRAVSAATKSIPSNCHVIARANAATLKLTLLQKGKFVAVLVTGSSPGNATTSWLSKSTGKIL